MYRRIVVKVGLLPVSALLLVLFSWTDQMAAAQPAPTYRLPWEGGSAHAVTQGYFRTDESGSCIEGCSTHKTVSMRSSWDFKFAEGTKVVAARSGRVTLVEDKWNPNHCGSPYPIKNPPPGYVVNSNIANEANYVVIDHGDGTAALYLHLSKVADPIKRKAQAKETVEQGEELGLSGKTGWTHCGPHLHFQVQQAGGWFTQSRPITFSDRDVVAKHPDGVPISAGRVNPYTSDNGSSQEATLAALWAKMEANWGKDDEAAIAALEEIMKIDSSYRQTREKLYALLVSKADRLESQGNREGAVTAIKRALEVNPAGVEALQRLASYTAPPGWTLTLSADATQVPVGTQVAVIAQTNRPLPDFMTVEIGFFDRDLGRLRFGNAGLCVRIDATRCRFPMTIATAGQQTLGAVLNDNQAARANPTRPTEPLARSELLTITWANSPTQRRLEPDRATLPISVDAVPFTPGRGWDMNSPLIKASQAEISKLSSSLPHRNKLRTASGRDIDISITGLQHSLDISIYNVQYNAINPMDKDYDVMRSTFLEGAYHVLSWLRSKGIDTSKIIVSWGDRAYIRSSADIWFGTLPSR